MATQITVPVGDKIAPPAAPTPKSPFLTPALYPGGVVDAITALNHMVERPDLVRIDADGKPSEIATLIVDGKIFEDWETVWIQWEWTAQYSQFKFTCAEREPYPDPAGLVLQFAPGSQVEVFLGGIQVITGVIVSRQVAYDANNHVVQLQGISASWSAARSSIDHPTQDFSGKSFLQIAEEILKPTGVTFKTLGTISDEPFKVATNTTGETIGQFLEKLARWRKIIISNLPGGQYLFIGEHSGQVTGELVEGVNIKKMQCVISVELARTNFMMRGSTPASDDKYGADASEQESKLAGTFPGGYSILLSAGEHPVWSQAEMDKRNANDKMWNEDMTKIDATITVYGWFRPLPTTIASWAVQQLGPSNSHTLWQAGDDVVVHSPMAMLFNQHLKIKTVTWMQDSTNGTQTILNCVLPNGMNGVPIPIEAPSPVTGRAPGPV